MVFLERGQKGAFIVIAKIKKEGLEAFKESLFEYVKKNSHASWANNTFGDLAKKGHQVNFILVNSPWVEVDTKEDYKEAQRLFGAA